jgi:PhnB protein
LWFYSKKGDFTMAVKPIPDGYRTVTPYLVVSNAAAAIDFYKRAFGAKEIMRMDTPQGKIAHAEIKIGDSMIMLGDEMPGTGARSPESLGGTCTGIFLYVPNVDSVFKQAESAGAKALMPPVNMFWGDRYGKLTDPFGHQWSLATHVEDVAPEEMGKRMKEEMAKMAQTSKATS